MKLVLNGLITLRKTYFFPTYEAFGAKLDKVQNVGPCRKINSQELKVWLKKLETCFNKLCGIATENEK